ncbi:hypothetical protein V8E36_003469, partial [Tilletia maclaganii]
CLPQSSSHRSYSSTDPHFNDQTSLARTHGIRTYNLHGQQSKEGCSQSPETPQEASTEAPDVFQWGLFRRFRLRSSDSQSPRPHQTKQFLMRRMKRPCARARRQIKRLWDQGFIATGRRELVRWFGTLKAAVTRRPALAPVATEAHNQPQKKKSRSLHNKARQNVLLETEAEHDMAAGSASSDEDDNTSDEEDLPDFIVPDTQVQSSSLSFYLSFNNNRR